MTTISNFRMPKACKCELIRGWQQQLEYSLMCVMNKQQFYVKIVQ